MAQTKHLNTETRPARIPVVGHRNILAIPDQDPNYHYTWQPEYNVEQFMQGGYDIVLDMGLVDPTTVTVNTPTKINGWKGARVFHQRDGITLVAMRIPLELRKEDEAAIDAATDATEEQVAQPIESGYGKVESDGGQAKVIIRNKE